MQLPLVHIVTSQLHSVQTAVAGSLGCPRAARELCEYVSKEIAFVFECNSLVFDKIVPLATLTKRSPFRILLDTVTHNCTIMGCGL